MLNAFTGSPSLFGAAIVLGILVPFAASAVLDGIVHAVRGRGFTYLLVTITLTAVLVFAGALLWNAGVYDPATSAEAADAADLEGHLIALLWVSVPFAIIGFMIRAIVRWSRSRRA
jgi:hypothetical protein